MGRPGDLTGAIGADCPQLHPSDLKARHMTLTLLTQMACRVLLLLCISAIAGCGSHLRKGEIDSGKVLKDPPRSAENSLGTRPTAAELEARLMGFADRYLSKTAEATDRYQMQVKTKAARELGLATFVFPGLNVIGIAAGGEPVADLLDMVVFVTLQRESLDSGWAHSVLGSEADNLIRTQKQLEVQSWEIARSVFLPAQIDRLKQSIAAWRRSNPDQRYVSNVKFDDVAATRGADDPALMDESDSLLAPLDAAVREGEEIRLTAKRSMYVLQRMPPLLLAQARFVLHEEVSPEQVARLLEDISGFRAILEQTQKTIADLPRTVAREREALIRDIDKVTPVLDKGHTLSQDVNQNLVTFRQIVDAYPTSGAVLNDTLRLYLELTQSMNQSAPSDWGPKIQLLHEVSTIAAELNRLVESVNPQQHCDTGNPRRPAGHAVDPKPDLHWLPFRDAAALPNHGSATCRVRKAGVMRFSDFRHPAIANPDLLSNRWHKVKFKPQSPTTLPLELPLRNQLYIYRNRCVSRRRMKSEKYLSGPGFLVDSGSREILGPNVSRNFWQKPSFGKDSRSPVMKLNSSNSPPDQSLTLRMPNTRFDLNST